MQHDLFGVKLNYIQMRIMRATNIKTPLSKP
jgi:hypothetical protein